MNNDYYNKLARNNNMTNVKSSDEIAVLAHQCYINKEYSTALQHLKELEGLSGGHKRVQHNKAVIEFMNSDMKDVDNFSKALEHLLGVTFPDIENIEIVSPFLMYNYAVLLYHSRYYCQCVVILEKILESKNVKDNQLLQQVILLLMEAMLCRRTYDKTLEIAKLYEESIINDPDELFARLVGRAELLVPKKDPNKKVQLYQKSYSLENFFVLAQNQYLNGELTEAFNTLSRCKTMKHNYNLKTQGEDIWAAINNNVAIMYLSVKRPYLAAKYFQHAVKEHFKGMESDDSKRLIICKDKPIYVYNLGLALLSTTNTEGAFECLVEAARHYPNNPKIWLHLAECCVRKCCNDEVQQFTLKKLGSGPHTRILLAKEKEKYSLSGESFAIPSLSLEFAALCLRNAMTLLPNQDIPNDFSVPFIQAPPGPPIDWKQRCNLKNTILVLQSYILIQLQDPLSALTSANQLLSQPEVSNSHKAWAHIYAAEALINLDRISDAVEHLHPPMIHELVSVLPAQMRDMIAVSVWAKAAVCHILRGDLVTARKILLQINSPRVLPLQMYLEICTGNIENCHTILRKLRFTTIS